MSKSLIFLVKSFLGKFYRHLAIFFWSHWTCGASYKALMVVMCIVYISHGSSYFVALVTAAVQYTFPFKEIKMSSWRCSSVIRGLFRALTTSDEVNDENAKSHLENAQVNRPWEEQAINEIPRNGMILNVLGESIELNQKISSKIENCFKAWTEQKNKRKGFKVNGRKSSNQIVKSKRFLKLENHIQCDQMD